MTSNETSSKIIIIIAFLAPPRAEAAIIPGSDDDRLMRLLKLLPSRKFVASSLNLVDDARARPPQSERDGRLCRRG